MLFVRGCAGNILRTHFDMQKHIKTIMMCHFLAPLGQPEMMHKNFMRRNICQIL